MDIKRNQIYEMDCMEVLQSLPAGSVDLIIADPPYYHCWVTIITDKITKKIDKLQLNMIKLNYREIVTKYMII